METDKNQGAAVPGAETTEPATGTSDAKASEPCQIAAGGDAGEQKADPNSAAASAKPPCGTDMNVNTEMKQEAPDVKAGTDVDPEEPAAAAATPADPSDAPDVSAAGGTDAAAPASTPAGSGPDATTAPQKLEVLELPVADSIQQPVNNLNHKLVHELRKHMYHFDRADAELSKLGLSNNLQCRDRLPKMKNRKPPTRPPLVASCRKDFAPVAAMDEATTPCAGPSGVAVSGEGTTAAAPAAATAEDTPVAAAPSSAATDGEGNAAAAPDCGDKASAGAPADVEMQGDEKVESVCFL